MSVPTPWFSSYKAFTPAQESKETLEQSLNKIISKWQKQELKEDVLLKLKDKVISVFGVLRLKGMV